MSGSGKEGDGGRLSKTGKEAVEVTSRKGGRLSVSRLSVSCREGCGDAMQGKEYIWLAG